MIDATKPSKQINKRNRQKSDNLLDNDTQNMKKSNKQKRKLSQVLCVKKSDTKAIKLMLPY